MKKAIIWCFERDMWWKANKCGYTTELYEAGVYTVDEATAIVEQANITVQEGQMPNEVLFEVEVDNQGHPINVDLVEFFNMIISVTQSDDSQTQQE